MGERHAAGPVAADGQRFLTSVDGVVVAEGFGPGRGDGHVQAIAVVDLVELLPGLEIAELGVGEHDGASWLAVIP